MATMNRQIVLAARPEGLPKPSDFRLVETPVPELTEGQFLVKTNYLSVDPYMRGRISEAKSYAEPVQIGQVMVGGTVGTVVESRHPGYRPGEVVVGYWGWQEYAVSDGQGIERFDTSLAPMSTALGVLGMPGMTAYFGLLEIGKPKAGRDGVRLRRRRGRGIAGRPDRQDQRLPRGRLRRIAAEGGLPHRRVGLRRGLQLQGREGLRRQAPGGLPQRDRRLLRQRGRAAHRRRVHPDQRRRHGSSSAARSTSTTPPGRRAGRGCCGT